MTQLLSDPPAAVQPTGVRHSTAARGCAGACERRRRMRLPYEDQVPPLLHSIGPLPDVIDRLIRHEGNRSRWYRAAKRLIDIAGAALLLLLLSPVMLAVLLILTVTTRGRPLFIQRRVGYRGRTFPMIKFRTMRLDAERLQHLVPNEHRVGPIFKNRRDPRVTRIGRILRRTSLDETPQLINVLLGHMSLVGPRPPVPKEVAKYKWWQLRRLAVTPGLTCFWQVAGRSEIGFEDWVRMDIRYLQSQNFWTDLKLLVKTPLSVLSCRGAY